MSISTTIPFIVPPGQAVAVSLAGAMTGDEAVVEYSPDQGPKAAFSTYMQDKAPLTLDETTSPLVVSVPGQYRLQVSISDGSTATINTSQPFPVVLTKALP